MDASVFALEVQEAPRAPQVPETSELERDLLGDRSGAPVGPVARGPGFFPDPLHVETRQDVREALGFAVSLWSKLPAGVTLHCTQDGVGFVVTTSRKGYADALSGGVPALLGGELACVARAVAVGEFVPLDLACELSKKAAMDSHRVTLELATNGRDAPELPEGMTVGETLLPLGVRVDRVEVHA